LKEQSGKIKKSKLIEEMLVAYYYGLKTLYYQNIRSNNAKDGEDLPDGVVEDMIDDDTEACSGGGCSI